MQRLDIPVTPDGGCKDLRGAAAAGGLAGDAEGGDVRAQRAVVRVADDPLDQEGLGSVENNPWGRPDLSITVAPCGAGRTVTGSLTRSAADTANAGLSRTSRRRWRL
jgi:hypothetical protein